MLMLKIAGGVLIIGASSLMGYFYSRRGATREKELLEMKKALTFFKNEIRFLLTPFGEAAAAVSQRVNAPVCGIFGAAGEEALRCAGRPAEEIWREAVLSAENDSCYTKEDIDAFMSLGKSVGAPDAQAQNQSLELLIEYIDGSVRSLRENWPQQSKMYRSLGFLGGALITIILL